MNLTTWKVSLRAHPVSACRLACCVSILAFTGAVLGDEPRTDDLDPPQDVVTSRPLSDGFVLVDGAYVAPPYVVERRDAEVFINGHPFALSQSGAIPGRRFVTFRGHWPRGNFAGMGWRGNSSPFPNWGSTCTSHSASRSARTAPTTRSFTAPTRRPDTHKP